MTEPSELFDSIQRRATNGGRMDSLREADQIVQQGEELYDREIREKVEQGNHGRFVVIDIASGDYEVADEDLAASEKVLKRHPQALLYGVRIGYPAALRIGYRDGAVE